MKNQALANIAEAQKAKLNKNMQDAFERIVLAGMDFIYKNEQTSAMSMQTIEKAESVPVGVGEGIAMIIMLLLSKSRGKMPMEAGVMAGYALVCEGLDFVEQKGILKVTNDEIDTAMGAYAQKLMNTLKITDAQVSKLKDHADQASQDPKIRAAYTEKYGAMPTEGMPSSEMPAAGMPPTGGLVGRGARS